MNHLLKILLVFTFASPLHAEEIKIFIWEHFISEKVIEQFTQKTGHTIKQYYYDSEVDRNALLVNGQGNNYDLVLVDNATTNRYGKIDILTPLASANIDNIENNGHQWRKSCGEYGIPYSYGTIGIAHRSSVSKEKIDSWNNILTPPKEHIGTTMMLKDDLDTVAIALLAKGFDPFTNDKNELKLAYSALKEQSKYLLQYGFPLTYVDEQQSASKLTLTVVYSGDTFNLEQSTGQRDWKYVVPKEGTLLFVDCFTAPNNGELKEATKAFLAFINEPTIAYENASEMWFSTTNEAATLIADDEYKNDSEISPNAELIKRSVSYAEVPKESLVIRNRMVSILKIQE